ncbi:hypothetical protein [Maridesulfovibrio sp. FT414]|uniref:hypothetical protein n=1 Tax=Maridesulfovibrio sp. FT414 TaxID=2979469 RepID=UPI003D80A2ED
MSNGNRKIGMLFIGLSGFALFGTIIFYVAGLGGPPRPELAAGFRFYKSISLNELNFSDSEVLKLNSTLQKNRNVVENTTLTITDAAGRRSELRYSIKIKAKSGMIFSPETRVSARRTLVNDIASQIDRGAGILANYADIPDLKNREVTIVDM